MRWSSVREPTASRVATNSSTTPRRIVRCRLESSISTVFCMFAGILRKQLGRDAAAEEPAALGQRQATTGVGYQPESLEPLERRGVHGAFEPVEGERLVEPQPEEHALPLLDVRGQPLELALRALARAQRREVAPEPRRRPPAPAVDRRDRAYAEPEVVAAAPVGEVVPRAKVAAPRVGAAEVRRLVPAEARGQARDDALEVRLHGLGLTRELLPVRVREARAGLGLELVGRDVLRPERERLVQVGVEVVRRLTRNPVDQIE